MSWSSAIGSGVDAFSSILGNTGWLGLSSYSVKSKKDLQRAQQLQTWQALNLPDLQRQGLESAGYNPLLAVGSASPSVGGTVTSGASSGSGGRLGMLEAVNTAADIRLKEAQTQRTLSDAYVAVHYTRAEAKHFGVSLLAKLGINLGQNKSESFTLLYNPITKELVNPINLYSTNLGHANSAEDVKPTPTVDVKMDAWKPEGARDWTKFDNLHL